MKISWLGHACFLIRSIDGTAIITDPFDDSVGYPQPRAAADLITVSHQHFDHNAVEMVSGKPRVIQTAGEHRVNGLKITGIPCYHDNAKGSLRGKNLIFVFEEDGFRVCHLGDLGHIPDQKLLGEIGNIDVLLIPVGGLYTIDASEAKEVISLITPSYVVPMHYKTPHLKLPISPVDNFLIYFPEHIVADQLDLSPGKKHEKLQVVVLNLTKP
ncbi:MAG TPA: MBL fold metallo-hydrolase [Desulfotomaculum sp.]|nr:MAG: putative Zn-dependent hydrolase [Desulfotomaculum sp. 46_80]KUK85274.1 MAG: putative Zn-dependent hydrolase [Desulfofundulus kuznetsovii]HAG11458.1 MBL fold metallo-hydrolase [Desulfotomaculum sp.]HBY03222.1 MBL fold metallo-hydrolase [Desulfotomaculum sp.]